jgi:pyridoxal phosphate enzyme (YggS family)
VDIELNLRDVRARIARACQRSSREPDAVTLVAVTKGFDASVIKAAFDCGLRDFGENRVQEAMSKMEQLTDLRQSITWHMVGHLQSNKAKIAVQNFDIIHSVDSARLAMIINQHTRKLLPILLQVNLAVEETKSGFTMEEVMDAVQEIRKLRNLEIKGLMTIAPFVQDPEEVRPVFRRLRELRDSIGLEHLSMGMTDDFEVAVEEGSTILRIGRAIFGHRRYT